MLRAVRNARSVRVYRDGDGRMSVEPEGIEAIQDAARRPPLPTGGTRSAKGHLL